MTIRERFVSMLLRIYSPQWRREYGAELSDVLLTQPLSAGVVADVLWNGARQRARSLPPSTVFGIAAMLAIVAGFAQNIAAPLPYASGAATSLLQPSRMVLPTLVVAPLKSNLYALALIACGCWTRLRSDRSNTPGFAAVRMSLLAGVPVMLAALLMFAGILATTAIGPADTPTTIQQHGFTYTFYADDHVVPSAWSVLVSPLFQLPLSWLWGNIGGHLGQLVARRTRVA
jgi:hypothetical protein